MDNDNKLVKIIKKKVKAARFKIEYFGTHIEPLEMGNRIIQNIIDRGEPASVVRLGSTETHCACLLYTSPSPRY